MLLIAAVAVWLAYWQTSREVERMQLALPGLRDAARQLRIGNPHEYAVVRHHELWNDDFRWDAYLPAGGDYVMRLATEQIDTEGLAEPVKQYAIGAGRRAVQLFYEKVDDRWRIEVTVDDQLVLQDTQPLSWHEGGGSTGGAAFDQQAQQDVGQPLVLFRRRFMEKQSNGGYSTPAGPTAGLLLWIEREPGS